MSRKKKYTYNRNVKKLTKSGYKYSNKFLIIDACISLCSVMLNKSGTKLLHKLHCRSRPSVTENLLLKHFCYQL